LRRVVALFKENEQFQTIGYMLCLIFKVVGRKDAATMTLWYCSQCILKAE
jgi:hypothetical protein